MLFFSSPSVSAVATALAAQPGGEAYAGALTDAVADLAGISRRQAQRWIKAAVAAAPEQMERLPKDEGGTIYRLLRPARTAVADVPTELADVPRHHRRDVALSVLALARINDEADGAMIVSAIAGLTERPLEWAASTLRAAVPYLGAIADVWVSNDWDQTVTAHLDPDVSVGPFRPWAAAPDFGLPGERLSLQRELRERLGDRRLRLPPGEYAAVAALAALGGAATRQELAECCDESAEATKFLAGLAARTCAPRWLEQVRGSGRGCLRLAEQLWP